MSWANKEPHFGNIQAIQDRLLKSEFGVKASGATAHQIEQTYIDAYDIYCERLRDNEESPRANFLRQE
jgi:hypothetical protein